MQDQYYTNLTRVKKYILQAKGIEPFLPEYEPSVLPLTLYLANRVGFEPTTFWLTAKRSNPWATDFGIIGFEPIIAWFQIRYVTFTLYPNERGRIRTYGTILYNSLANYLLKPLRHSSTHYWARTNILLKLIFEISASTNSAKWEKYLRI